MGLDALAIESAYTQEFRRGWTPGIESLNSCPWHAYAARLDGISVVHQSALCLVEFGKDVSVQMTGKIADTPYDFVLWHIYHPSAALTPKVSKLLQVIAGPCATGH
jgi:hypothetical protein